MPAPSADGSGKLRICLLGATGTIGGATLRELTRRGHEVVCLVRPRPGGAPLLEDAVVRAVDTGARGPCRVLKVAAPADERAPQGF